MAWLPEVHVAVARRPLSCADLDGTERVRFAALPSIGPRRRDWLVGRRALRSLPVGGGHTSVSHSGGLAVAASAPEDRADGVGVDLELGPAPELRAHRFYLRHDDRGGDPLVLWTVKEAVFKADPANDGRALVDYRIVSSRVAEGPDGRCFAFRSTPWRGGVVTIAVARCN